MSIETRLAALAQPSTIGILQNIARGIEKESLRVEPSGRMASTPHPQALGSALTHPSITTDYSEALLEFITAPSASIDDVLNELLLCHPLARRAYDANVVGRRRGSDRRTDQAPRQYQARTLRVQLSSVQDSVHHLHQELFAQWRTGLHEPSTLLRFP